jgi:hypothetical protein
MLLLAIGAGAIVVARAAVLWFAGWSVDGSVLGAAVATAAWALVLAPLALLLVTRSSKPAPPNPVRLASPGGVGSAGGVGAS